MSNPGLNDGAADEDMYASDAAAEAGPLNAEERGQGNKILVSNSKTASAFRAPRARAPPCACLTWHAARQVSLPT